ncbi:hypothetical protein BS17DRAFT_562035 [Gyrodon lividus]|nr:hypothetical protein BS17DRAFT_562035 [Gyrodon lividus]
MVCMIRIVAMLSALNFRCWGCSTTCLKTRAVRLSARINSLIRCYCMQKISFRKVICLHSLGLLHRDHSIHQE